MSDYELCPGMYKRQYRAKPRAQTIRGLDMVKCLAVVMGFVLLCWAIVFG